MYLNDVFTIPADMSGCRASRCPAASRLRPAIGLQLIGRALDEATVLRAARAYERATTGTRAARSCVMACEP